MILSLAYGDTVSTHMRVTWGNHWAEIRQIRAWRRALDPTATYRLWDDDFGFFVALKKPMVLMGYS